MELVQSMLWRSERAPIAKTQLTGTKSITRWEKIAEPMTSWPEFEISLGTSYQMN